MRAVILSAALDTNGQNARYARASERWGDEPDVVRAFAIGNADPAGVVGRFQNAALKYPGLRIRSAHRASAYFDFPVDLVWNRQTEPLIAELVDEADVLHLNNSHRAVQRFRVRKPMLLHHHGTLFRTHPDQMLAVARAFRMVQAVSTVDLTRPAPDLLHWLPTAYDVDDLVAYGEANRRPDDDRVRIVHCPTNRKGKATEVLVAAVADLETEGLPVDLDIVEGQTWAESIRRKAAGDVLFDQLAYGYGCNAVEAWGLGKPVVAGADGWTLDAMRRTFGGPTPFYAANERNLVDKLRRIVTSATMRAEYAGRGMEHVRRFHDERPALARLAELYAEAIRHFAQGRIPGKGAPVVTFENPYGRRVYVDDQVVPWVDGRWQGDDPYVVQRLRSLAVKRPLWGIREVSP